MDLGNSFTEAMLWVKCHVSFTALLLPYQVKTYKSSVLGEVIEEFVVAIAPSQTCSESCQLWFYLKRQFLVLTKTSSNHKNRAWLHSLPTASCPSAIKTKKSGLGEVGEEVWRCHINFCSTTGSWGVIRITWSYFSKNVPTVKNIF